MEQPVRDETRSGRWRKRRERRVSVGRGERQVGESGGSTEVQFTAYELKYDVLQGYGSDRVVQVR